MTRKNTSQWIKGEKIGYKSFKGVYMKVFYIKAFEDNYIWTLEKDKDIILVDPGDAKPALEYLDGKNLVAILLTHKHLDHTGGVEDLKAKYPFARVFGPIETENLNDKTLKEGDTFSLLAYDFKVIKTAGHTYDHISYLVDGKLFCGDALFSSGCGRVFTGRFDLSFETIDKIRSLPEETLVYPAHEYTIKHLTSSKNIIKEDFMDEEIKKAKESLALGKPTLPTSIKREWKINPLFKAKDSYEFKDFTKLKNMD